MFLQITELAVILRRVVLNACLNMHLRCSALKLLYCHMQKYFGWRSCLTLTTMAWENMKPKRVTLIMATVQRSSGNLVKTYQTYQNNVTDKVNPALPTALFSCLCQSDLDVGHFQASRMPYALCHVSRAVPEQFLWRGSTHCPVGTNVVEGGGWCGVMGGDNRIQGVTVEYCPAARWSTIIPFKCLMLQIIGVILKTVTHTLKASGKKWCPEHFK